MSEVKQFDPEREFDDIMAAVASNDHAALDKLMESEPNPNPTVKETAEEVTPEVVAGGEPVVETPATEPVVEKKDDGTAVEPTPDPDPKVEPVVDPNAELEALRAQVHRLQSDAGRIPFTQRRIKELETELATYRAAKAAGGAGAGNADVELDAETRAVIEDLKATDPVMAKALETVAKKAVSTATNKVTDAFTEYGKTAQEADDERLFAEQWGILTAQIPQAPQIFASNEWKQWKQGLSPGRRAMAESILADEVATAVYAFAADMQRMSGQPAPVQQQPVQAVVNANDEAAQRAIQERNRKVASAAGVVQPAAKVTDEFDEEKAYLEMYQNIAKANHIK